MLLPIQGFWNALVYARSDISKFMGVAKQRISSSLFSSCTTKRKGLDENIKMYLVGLWRILWRFAGHRRTIDDLVTTYIAGNFLDNIFCEKKRERNNNGMDFILVCNEVMLSFTKKHSIGIRY